MRPEWRVAGCGIPAYDALADPLCPWGMAAVFNAQQRAMRARPVEAGLKVVRGRRILPTKAYVDPPLPNVTYDRTADIYESELDLVKLALQRNASRDDEEETRRATISLGLGLRRRRKLLGRKAPVFRLGADPYVVKMLCEDRNPLRLPAPHPALAPGSLDREPGPLHPYYGVASDAERALVTELRASRDAVAALDAALDAAAKAQPPSATTKSRRARAEGELAAAVAASAKIMAAMKKARAATTYQASLDLERLEREETRLAADKRAWTRLLYAERRDLKAARRAAKLDPPRPRAHKKKELSTVSDDRRDLAFLFLRHRARQVVALAWLRATAQRCVQ